MLTFLIRLVTNSVILIQKLFVFQAFFQGYKAQDSGGSACVLKGKPVIAEK